MAHQDIAKQKPIGYWLKHADNVVTEHIDRVLSENDFTRSRWQVLNIVYQAGTVTRSDVLDTMQTFIDAPQLEEIVEEFAQEGWLVKRGEGDAAELVLTNAGKAQRDSVFKLQGDVRRRAMQGISEQEYATVINVLQRMVKNLE